jgi:hypothetical protein
MVRFVLNKRTGFAKPQAARKSSDHRELATIRVTICIVYYRTVHSAGQFCLTLPPRQVL